MKSLQRTAVWGFSIFLALIFVFVGLSKLQGASATRWSERFALWGYPKELQYVVGILEILGGIGLLVPRSRRIGAAILTIVMAGAVITHLIHAEFGRTIVPLSLAALALFVSKTRN